MQRPHVRALANKERAHALRSVNLVRADRVEVDGELLDVHRYLAHGLHAIGVEGNSGVASDSGDLTDRLNHSQLIIHVHNADQFRVGTDRGAHGLRVHHPASIHWSERRGRQLRRGLQHGGVFCGGSDNMPAGAENRHVVGFRAAAGEHNFFGLGAQHGRHRAPRAVQCATGFLSKLMDARSVAKYLGHQGSHGLKHFGRYRSGRVVIEVVGCHGVHYNLIST